jgi:hypothetical protein
MFLVSGRCGMLESFKARDPARCLIEKRLRQEAHRSRQLSPLVHTPFPQLENILRLFYPEPPTVTMIVEFSIQVPDTVRITAHYARS